MRWAWLLVAVLLAGCADEAPAPVQAGDVTYSDAHVPPGRPFAVLTWTTLASQPFVLTPAQDAVFGVDVPTTALLVSTNLTLETGGAFGLGAQLGDCRWQRDAAFVAGQAFAIDCGGVGTGSQTLMLRTSAGALRGTLDVVALVCQPDPQRLPCPAPFPPTTT